jgi:putative tryptophan/tyrosine transport system ATP-binding protein
MIKLQHITKTYNTGKPNQTIAINNVSLTIAPQDFVVIVGANGSGKSTLLNSISGLVACNQGQIFINNIDVTKLAQNKRSRYISNVFQNPLQGTAPNLSILENFRLAALRTSNKKLIIGTNKQFVLQVQHQIAQLDMALENKIHQPIGSLSGGQRQAISLLMSVFDSSKILLLDEPTAALDPKSAKNIMQLANKLIIENNLTAILVTHNLKDAFDYGNRIIKMNEGQIEKDINSLDKNKLLITDLFEWFV